MPESAMLNIGIETGADFVLPHKIKDNNGEPVDLTGSTITAHLRRYAEDAEYVEFYCTHNGKGGRILLTLTKEITAKIAYPDGVYDVRVTLADGVTSYTLNGSATIRQGVTKPNDGSALYMIGITSYEDLPTEGNVNRLYLCYDDRRIYRWNGQNYIATAVGNGIQRIDFIEHTSDFTDLYRVTYDDRTTWDYTVTSKGIHHVDKIGSSGTDVTGVIDTYRIYFSNGTTWDYTIENGHIMYATFNVDVEDGHLYMFTPDGYLGPDFELDETTGHLFAVVNE